MTTSKRQRIYLDSDYVDILSVLKDDICCSGLGEVLEIIIYQYVNNNHNELKELLDERKREYSKQ